MAKRRRKKRLKYFFADGDLHKTLSVNHAQDICIAWNYPQGRTVGYVWSDLRKRYTKAFSVSEVSDMIGRHRVNIQRYILRGEIKRPQQTYSLDERKSPGKFFMSEEDVYILHDYLMTVHIGRPRNDGRVIPGRLPTKTELRAMMRHDVHMYTKTDDGEFIPVWKEIDW